MGGVWFCCESFGEFWVVLMLALYRCFGSFLGVLCACIQRNVGFVLMYCVGFVVNLVCFRALLFPRSQSLVKSHATVRLGCRFSFGDVSACCAIIAITVATACLIRFGLVFFVCFNDFM